MKLRYSVTDDIDPLDSEMQVMLRVQRPADYSPQTVQQVVCQEILSNI